MSLAGKVALITGASRGIGKAILQRLAEEGATVVGTATSQAGVDAIRASLISDGFTGNAFVVDVTEQSSIDAMLAELQRTCGMPDILVNNAGITQDNLFLRMKDDEWMKVIDTNLNSIFRVSKACVKTMLKARWGRIVNISSVVGVAGAGGQANYAAAKAGIIGFSKSLAQEIASRNITVNVIAPGLIETDMTEVLPEAHKQAMLAQIPMGRAGQGRDIAAAVAFLCSEEASYITGVTLHVNGGLYMA